MRKNGNLISTDEEKAEVLNKYLPQSSLATSLLTPPQLMDCQMGTRGEKPLPLQGKTSLGPPEEPEHTKVYET